MVGPIASAAAGRRLGSAFWRLWTATVVSRFGDAVRGPALALLAAALTRESTAGNLALPG